ncbi:MAG TPA: hypothetical protein VHZ74_12715 [Bryobacteraceae bacterium]|nr:hypothetical protein [Bryobacteraceae bacterium]
MTISRRILYPLTAAVILAYFLFFTWNSRHMYFDADDMYALYFAWSKPLMQIVRENLYLWRGEFRPLGAFFYRGIYAVAGFDPYPFRIAELSVCIADMGICFWFIRLVSASERTAALATLLFAFQVRMLEVWFRTTVIFDALCFTFLYLALGLYIHGRRGGADLSRGRIAAILLLFVCALNSKEFAVCLPLFIVAWELLFNTSEWNPAKPMTWLKSRAALLIAAMGVLVVVYAIGKLHGPAAMSTNPGYTPEYSYTRFTETWGEYLKDLFVLADRPPGYASISILGGMVALAIAIRSRVLAFAWVILLFGMLPVSFSPARGGYEIYAASWLGWVLYAASLLVALQDFVTRRVPQYRTALAAAMFILVGWGVGKVNLHDLRHGERTWLYDPPKAAHTMVRQLVALHATLPPQARVLFLEDGFTTQEWTPLFIMRIIYDSPTMVVDRLKRDTAKPAGWEQYMSADRVHYDYVFDYLAGRYIEVQKRSAIGGPAAKAY